MSVLVPLKFEYIESLDGSECIRPVGGCRGVTFLSALGYTSVISLGTPLYRVSALTAVTWDYDLETYWRRGRLRSAM